MIISPDDDGLLSAALLHHRLNWQVAGYYDGQDLWLSQRAEDQRADLVGVNMDICRPGFPSLGRGILTFTGDVPAAKDHLCNPNLLWGVGAERIRHRFPFSTVIFLLWLHDVPLRKDLLARLLVLHAASSWLNAQRYPGICARWQERLSGYDWPWLFARVDTPLFEQRLEEQLYPRLARLGALTHGSRRRGKHRGLREARVRLNPDWDEDVILNLWTLYGTFLKWSPPRPPPILERIRGEQTREAPLKQERAGYPGSPPRAGLFSYSIGQRGTVTSTRLEW